jgi:hypothetical protein
MPDGPTTSAQTDITQTRPCSPSGEINLSSTCVENLRDSVQVQPDAISEVPIGVKVLLKSAYACLVSRGEGGGWCKAEVLQDQVKLEALRNVLMDMS